MFGNTHGFLNYVYFKENKKIVDQLYTRRK